MGIFHRKPQWMSRFSDVAERGFNKITVQDDYIEVCRYCEDYRLVFRAVAKITDPGRLAALLAENSFALETRLWRSLHKEISERIGVLRKEASQRAAEQSKKDFDQWKKERATEIDAYDNEQKLTFFRQLRDLHKTEGDSWTQKEGWLLYYALDSIVPFCSEEVLHEIIDGQIANWPIIEKALKRCDDQKWLISYAEEETAEHARALAISRIHDQPFLKKVAKNWEIWSENRCPRAAIANITDVGFLTEMLCSIDTGSQTTSDRAAVKEALRKRLQQLGIDVVQLFRSRHGSNS